MLALRYRSHAAGSAVLEDIDPKDTRVVPFASDSYGNMYFYMGFDDCRICESTAEHVQPVPRFSMFLFE